MVSFYDNKSSNMGEIGGELTECVNGQISEQTEQPLDKVL